MREEQRQMANGRWAFSRKTKPGFSLTLGITSITSSQAPNQSDVPYLRLNVGPLRLTRYGKELPR